MDYVGYFLFGAIVLILVSWLRSRRKTQRVSVSKKPKRAGEDASDSVVKIAKNLWASDVRIVFLTGLALLILNLMFKYMTGTIPELWSWYWKTDNHMYFVFFNIGWLAYAYFVSKRDEDKKPVPEARTKAKVIFWAIILFTVINIAGSTRNRTSNNSSASVQRGITPTFGGSVASGKEAVLQTIAMCESGNRQFDDKGRLIRNPDLPFVVGRWQLNTWAHRDLIVKEGWNVETEEGNKAAAEYLYNKYGTAPWTASVRCWGPKITEAGALTVTLQAFPGEGWSEPFEARQGFDFATGCMGPGKPRHKIEYTTRDNNVVVKEYPTPDGKSESIAGDVFRFRASSLEKDPVIVTIVLRKKT